jgi:hypothetical protein
MFNILPHGIVDWQPEKRGVRKLSFLRYGFLAVITATILNTIPYTLITISEFSYIKFVRDYGLIYGLIYAIFLCLCAIFLVSFSFGFILFFWSIIPFFIVGSLSALLYNKVSFFLERKRLFLIPIIVMLIECLWELFWVWFGAYTGGKSIFDYLNYALTQSGKGAMDMIDQRLLSNTWISFPLASFIVSYFIVWKIRISERKGDKCST